VYTIPTSILFNTTKKKGLNFQTVIKNEAWKFNIGLMAWKD
jgi:hypothetical protein